MSSGSLLRTRSPVVQHTEQIFELDVTVRVAVAVGVAQAENDQSLPRRCSGPSVRCLRAVPCPLSTFIQSARSVTRAGGDPGMNSGDTDRSLGNASLRR